MWFGASMQWDAAPPDREGWELLPKNIEKQSCCGDYFASVADETIA